MRRYSRRTLVGFIFASMLLISGCGGSTADSPNANTVAMKEVLTAGMFEFRNDPNYSVIRTMLDESGTNVISLASDYALSTKSWTSAIPIYFPAYLLSPSGTWNLINTSSPPQQLVAFNSDGSATFSCIGQIVTESVTAVDISGQTILLTDNFPPIFPSKNVFPAGSIRYETSYSLINGIKSYVVLDVYNPSLTTLDQIPTHYADSGSNELDIDSSSTTSYFFVKFVPNNDTVNIYERTLSYPSTTVKIGTGTYTTNSVPGQQILEVNIPLALRNQYSLKSYPIFATVNGKLMRGWTVRDETANINSVKSYSYNEIVANYIKANIDTTIAKPVIK